MAQDTDQVATDTPDVVAGPAVADVTAPDPSQQKDVTAWVARIDRCKKIRRELVTAWSDNVDFRRGKPFSQATDTDRVNVNLDWSLSKGKHAQLYSQTPQVYLTAKQKQFEAAIPVFAKQLNDTLTECNVGAAMDEAVLDAINASGIGIILVGYQALEEDVEVPGVTVTPEMEQAVTAGTYQIPMVKAKRTVSSRHYTKRLSPSNFLWPDGFTGSDFDQADWLGQSGELLWSEAAHEFKLTDKDKEQVLAARTKHDESLRKNADSPNNEELVVEFDEVYYWAYRFDPLVKQLKQINHIVFLRGKTEPVYNGPWKGQQFNEQTHSYIGACKFPLRVLTLTYISDDAIPPSDSAIGRPQIEEMIKSRGQIVMNRDRSQPMRWADVNRVDPTVLDSMMRGEYQAIYPIQGNGEKAIGEVARAAYPREDFEFDSVIRRDLEQQWQVNPNFEARQSAKEAGYIQQNFQTRIGYERARVASLFTGIAEVLGGHLALYGDFTIIGQEDIKRLDSGWDRKQFGNEVVYAIRPDATVLLDANQRIDRISKFLNLTGKSGFVNPKPLIAELAELHGIDPADVVVDPPKHEPQEPNISYRFSGVEDLTNALAVALMIKSGQAPSPQELDAAKNLLAAVSMPPEPPAPEQPPPGPDLNGQRPAANPNWGSADKVMKRNEDM